MSEKSILTIKEGTKYISAGEYKNAVFEGLKLPDSLVGIGDEAFSGCAGIRFLKLPDGLKKIGTGAFKDCENLKEVFIPASVEEIGEDAFANGGIINCERWEKADGWFFQYKERRENLGDDDVADITDYRTWYGSYSVRVCLSEREDYKRREDLRILWGRDWEDYVISDDGTWLYDVFGRLESLGEKSLRKGLIPNINPVARECLDEMQTLVDNEFASNDSIAELLEAYINEILAPFVDTGHGIEMVFCMWGVYYFVWQMSQTSYWEIREAWKRPVEIQMRELSELLTNLGGERWTRLEKLIGADIDLWNVRMCKLIKRYYTSQDRRFENKIFEAYDKRFFSEDFAPDEEMAKEGEESYKRAVELVEEKDYDVAGKLFEKAAKCGHLSGQYNYGVSLMNGEGCEANPLEGSYWYWKAANGGESRAMMNLAINYRNGWGVLESGTLMIYWYAKSAHELNPVAVYNLGLSLKHGEVIGGNAPLGLALIKASDEIDDGGTGQFVQRTTEAILSVVEKEIDKI